MMDEEPSYFDQISNDFFKYSGLLTGEPVNVFKSLKRLFLIAKFTKSDDLLKQIAKTINNPGGIAYSVLSDIEIMIVMIERIKDPPLEFLMLELDEFRPRMSHVPFDFNQVKFDHLIEIILNNFIEKDKLIEMLKEIEEIILNSLNNYSLKFLSEIMENFDINNIIEKFINL